MRNSQILSFSPIALDWSTSTFHPHRSSMAGFLSSPQDTESIQRTFNAHDLIPLQPDILWKIEQGIIRTMTWSEDGMIATLGLWGQGDVVGRCLSSLEPYQIECLTKVEVSILRSPLWQHTIDAILRHAQHTEELLNIAHCQRVPMRLIQLLYWLEQKFGRSVHEGRLIDLRLTHQVLAETINTTRVTVTRLLSQLEKQGVVRRHRGRLILLQPLSLLD